MRVHIGIPGGHRNSFSIWLHESILGLQKCTSSLSMPTSCFTIHTSCVSGCDAYSNIYSMLSRDQTFASWPFRRLGGFWLERHHYSYAVYGMECCAPIEWINQVRKFKRFPAASCLNEIQAAMSLNRTSAPLTTTFRSGLLTILDDPQQSRKWAFRGPVSGTG